MRILLTIGNVQICHWLPWKVASSPSWEVCRQRLPGCCEPLWGAEHTCTEGPGFSGCNWAMLGGSQLRLSFAGGWTEVRGNVKSSQLPCPVVIWGYQVVSPGNTASKCVVLSGDMRGLSGSGAGETRPGRNMGQRPGISACGEEAVGSPLYHPTPRSLNLLERHSSKSQH